MLKEADETRLILVNAIYFKGAWTDPFSSGFTKKKAFYVSPQKTVEVDMMHHKDERLDFYEGDQVKVLRMSYIAAESCEPGFRSSKREVDMYVFLPQERSLTAEKLILAILKCKQHDLSIQLPKFTVESSFSMSQTLKRLGVQTAFSQHADFSRITEHEGLMIYDVVHKGFISVDEEGTEAAAATAGYFVPGCAFPEGEFHADHSFLYVIVNAHLSVLFVGTVVDFE